VNIQNVRYCALQNQRDVIDSHILSRFLCTAYVTLLVYSDMSLLMEESGLRFTLVFCRMTVLLSYVSVDIYKDCFQEQDAARPPRTHNVLNFRGKHLETECFQTDFLTSKVKAFRDLFRHHDSTHVTFL
jgi:hypothetical protein